jgi:predicted RecB family nuclease
MSLPDGFIFSQSNLQDYVDCQRRFQLRYILHQAWPAVEAEPYIENEIRIEQGARFHQIVHQHLVGIPQEKISISVTGDVTVESWWNNYLQSISSGVLKPLYESGLVKFEEISLAISIGKFRLVAKYDLLIIQPQERWTILDWKTSNKHPKRRWLEDRLQTHIYPYVLTGAGGKLVGSGGIDPNNIEMIYWFTNHPSQPEHFSYSASTFHEDARYLNNLISTVSQKDDPVFPLTPDIKRCLYCTYRSLCNRGIGAGDLQHLEEWMEPDIPDEVSIDFDQIGEIEV